MGHRITPDPGDALPEALCSAFTPAQRKVLAVVAARVSRSRLWRCELTRREMAAAAGVGCNTVRRALSHARLLGVVREEVSETFQLGNMIEVTSADWRQWIADHPSLKRIR